MRRPVPVVSILVALAAAGWAIADARIPRGLVGFTSAYTNGSVGVLSMSAFCQAQYAGSRMCTSAEVMATQTIPYPVQPNVSAWVLPSYVGGSASGPIDSSGLTGPNNCGGWSNVDSVGLSVDGQGRFSTTSCGTDLRVACCSVEPEQLGDMDRDGDLDVADSTLLRRVLAGETSALPPA